MEYDIGLIAWLRGLPERQPTNQIDRRDPVDAHFSALAVSEGLAALHELPNYEDDSDRAHVLLVDVTSQGLAALAENA
jgi:hypothetical protein